MMKKNDSKKETPLKENPAENPLEKEIDDLIDREKTKRAIVSKLLHQTNAKNQLTK
ncbi:MAG: hypothetical protein K9H16_09335 [Bacteroidales bacterium]|nr:hypothetical protein [Bacteroidales bacterium]